MPVALIAAGVGAAATVYAGNQASSAAKSASKQAAATADKEIALQQQAYDNARTTLTPYSQEGAQARRMYNGAMGIAPTAGADTLDAARAAYDSGFTNSPYWQDAQYGADQAMNALMSTNAAEGRGGSINSGKALRAAEDIQTGYRGQATQNYLTSLAGVAGTGFQADTGIASGGQTFANTASNALSQASQQQGQYAMTGATAAGGAAAGVANSINYALGNYQPGGTNYFTAPAAWASAIPTPNTGDLTPVSPIPNYRY